jgi:hypothetical protein
MPATRAYDADGRCAIRQRQEDGLGDGNNGPAADGGDRDVAGVDISVDDELYLAVRVQARRLKRTDESVFDEALRDWLAKTVDERPVVPGRLDDSVRAFCRDLDEPVAVALAAFLDALRQGRTATAAAAAARQREEAAAAPRRGRRRTESAEST